MKRPSGAFMPRNVSRRQQSTAGRGRGGLGAHLSVSSDFPYTEESEAGETAEETIPSMSTNRKCRFIADFELLDQLGKGEFGVVLRAKEKGNADSDQLCIKELKFDFSKEGFPIEGKRRLIFS